MVHRHREFRGRIRATTASIGFAARLHHLMPQFVRLDQQASQFGEACPTKLLPLASPPVSPTRSMSVLVLLLRQIHRIRHQHRDGQRTHAARHRRVRGGAAAAHPRDARRPPAPSLCASNSSALPKRAASARSVMRILAHVDHRGAGRDEIAGDQAGPADGGHQNIGAAAFLGQIRGARMADGDRGVFLQQHQRHRLADDVAAAQHHRVAAVDRDCDNTSASR